MKKLLSCGLLLLASFMSQSQTLEPVVTKFIINTSGYTGYNGIPADVQNVKYTTTHVYPNCTGIPAYSIGPWPGNPNQASNQNYTFKITRTPTVQSGTKTATGLGTIGVWKNGVPFFNAKDAMSYNNQNIWHQNAVVVEAPSFDACLGHPQQQGAYHNHQNPSCLYTPSATAHSPLLGWAFDGFPVYGAYGFKYANGTGGITRIRSGYQLRNITTRTTLPNGQALPPNQYGPPVSTQYPLGYYIEDYEYVAAIGDLDQYNGRVCVTPEYPAGIYCYFTTINANGTSAYPYVVGPSYYGVVGSVTGTNTVPAGTTTYSCGTPLAATITGSATGNMGAAATYSVAAVSGASYLWTVRGGQVTAGAGTTSITVAWDSAATAAVLVRITSGSCVGYNYKTVVVSSCVSASSSGTITSAGCNNAGAIALTASGGVPPYSFSWSNGATTQNLSGLAAGTYTVTVTTAASCTSTNSFVVPGGVAATSSGAITSAGCNNNAGAIALTATGGATPYSFLWSNGATTQNLSGLAAGTYTVTVTTAASCTSTNLFVVPGSAPATSSGTITSAGCNNTGGAIALTVVGGSAPYSFLWSNGATTQNLSGLTAGTYTVTVTTAANCTSTKSATVTSNTIKPTLGGAAFPTCCSTTSGEIYLTATGGSTPYTFLWTNGATTQNLSGLAAGSYTVTVTTAGGCTKTKAFAVASRTTPPPPQATTLAYTCNSATMSWTLPSTGTFGVRSRVKIGGVWSAWSAETNIGNVGSYTFSGLTQATTYQFSARYICSNGAGSSWVTKTQLLPGCFSEPNDPSGAKIAPQTLLTLAPNPASDEAKIQISALSEGEWTLEATDLLGQKVLSLTLFGTGESLEIPASVAAWSSGIYVVSLVQGEQRIIQKLVVDK